ncbi:ABC transporter ATP-binding protein [Ferrovibrio sp.]|uniref:ABC transporter ATP-binding protein n=1 Tax=Ferrovibrio sp. TaxID=1917215 RepID=UPI001B75E22F|nr:ABC transporter ATP-binding protein [Ferrovibrio sp.]MBP7063218.1 ABC transporter ATP-binding protein [Ferrovibrio sp.]
MAPQMMQAQPIQALSCQGISVRFGHFQALNNVSLDLPPGQTLALIGPNGAGKTTLINALSGRVAMAAGRIQLGDADISSMPVHRRAAAGLGRSFQIINIFEQMTVLENLRLAAQPRGFRRQPFWRSVAAWPFLAERARQVAAEVGLEAELDLPVAMLSHGKQRAVELGLALMTEPSVLLLDEPLAGVGQAEIEATMALLDRVRRGRSVLLVEHNMDAVMRIADEIVVMIGGEILMRGTPDAVCRDPEVRRLYLGSEEIVSHA